MKITITDNQGKEFVFETYYPVEVIGEHNKTFLCEEWILISGKKANEWFGYKDDEKLQFYTKEDIIKSGEMGEINHHDVKHIVSYLDEARQYNKTFNVNKQ
jgi:hypothetical protein